MVDVARVNLYGQPIGSVRWDQRYEIAQFEYDPKTNETTTLTKLHQPFFNIHLPKISVNHLFLGE